MSATSKQHELFQFGTKKKVKKCKKKNTKSKNDSHNCGRLLSDLWARHQSGQIPLVDEVPESFRCAIVLALDTNFHF